VPQSINKNAARSENSGQGYFRVDCVQHVTCLILDISYDQVLQAKATMKMLTQTAGEAELIDEGSPPSALYNIQQHDRPSRGESALQTYENTFMI